MPHSEPLTWGEILDTFQTMDPDELAARMPPAPWKSFGIVGGVRPFEMCSLTSSLSAQ